MVKDYILGTIAKVVVNGLSKDKPIKTTPKIKDEESDDKEERK